jgi:hypothetical protein
MKAIKKERGLPGKATQEDGMKQQDPDKLPLFEKMLAGACLAALGTSLASESVFMMTIFSVTVLAVVSLMMETWR